MRLLQIKSIRSVFAVSVAALLAVSSTSAAIQLDHMTDKSTGRAAWLDDAKYGMFIHWGIYSAMANGEWVMNRQKIPVAEYSKLADSFNPVKFDAEAWVAVAKAAGMQYITITSKHHDGFAMFDSDVDDYNIVDGTPFKRDVLMELKDACDAADIKLGFYYSQTQDWYHLGGAGRKWDDAQRGGTLREYLDAVSIPHLKELLTKYEPSHIWFDTPHAMTPEIGRELEAVVRNIRPDTIINSRLMYHGNQVEGLNQEQLDELVDIGVDFLSYRDRTIPPQSPWEYWETCMTLNNSWGYKKGDNAWKTPQQVIMQLVEVVSKGGAFLLNVGPTAEGEIPQPAIDSLSRAGEWLAVHGEAIYGAQITIFEGAGDYKKLSKKETSALEKEALATGAGKAKKGHKQKDYAWLATGREGKLYLHFFKWPGASFELSGLEDEVSKAYFLADPDRMAVQFTQRGNQLTIQLPDTAPDFLDSVLCLELKSL